MKRDLDLIRDILAKVDADPRFDGSHFTVFGPSDFPGYSQEQITYHIDLLFEADLVKGVATLDAPAAAISRLTWLGHEFLADTRDPDVWDKEKSEPRDSQKPGSRWRGNLRRPNSKRNSDYHRAKMRGLSHLTLLRAKPIGNGSGIKSDTGPDAE